MSKRGIRALVASVAVVAVIAGSTLAWSSTRAQRSGVAGVAPRGTVNKQGSCPSSTVDFASVDGNVGPITSTSYVNVTGLNRVIKVKGPGKSCVVIQLSAYAFIGSLDVIDVQATMGGTPLSPVDQQITGNDDTYGSQHSAAWVVTGVTPGTHRIRIKAKTFSGGSGFIGDAVMSIFHR
jgi:hypothetical protein